MDRVLRFNRSTICASDIAGQYYCEKKVEMEYIHGKIETKAKTIGSFFSITNILEIILGHRCLLHSLPVPFLAREWNTFFSCRSARNIKTRRKPRPSDIARLQNRKRFTCAAPFSSTMPHDRPKHLGPNWQHTYGEDKPPEQRP